MIISSAVNVAGVYFQSSGYNVVGSTINLTGTGGTICVDVGDATLASSITGCAGLTKLGDGKLIVAGNNDYYGITTISAGTLQLNAGAYFGKDDNDDVVNCASLLFYCNEGEMGVDNAISGTGTVTKTGSGTLTLWGANSYSGGTTISAGTLQIGDNDARLAGTLGRGDVFNYGSLVFACLVYDNTLTVDNHIIGSGSVVKTGPGTICLTGDSTYTGDTYLYDGALQFAEGALGISGHLIFDGGALQWAAGNTEDVSGRIDSNHSDAAAIFDTGDNIITMASVLEGSHGIVKCGSGTLILTGENTYTGGTTISRGTLQIGKGGVSGKLGGGAITDYGTLVFNRSDLVIVDRAIVGVIGLNGSPGTGALRQDGSGILQLTHDNSYGAGTTITNGTLQLGDGGATGTLGSGPVTNDSSLVIDRTGILSISGRISGTGSLTKQGGGTLILGGSGNAYSGMITISSGTIQVDYSGLWGGTIGSVAIAENAILDVKVDLIINGVVSGTGSLIKDLSGTLTLAGNNDFDGTTTIKCGKVLLIGDNSACDGATTINAGGTLQVGNGYFNPTASLPYLDGLSGTLGSLNSVIDNNGTLLFSRDTRGGSLEVNALIKGNGILQQAGYGTVVLTRDNDVGSVDIPSYDYWDAQNFHQHIRVSVLQVGNGGTSGTLGGVGDSLATITNDGTLIFNRSDDITIANIISRSVKEWSLGSVVQQGTGTLTLAGNSTYTGTTTISQGTIAVSDLDPSGGGTNLGNASSPVELLGDSMHRGTLSYTGNTTTLVRGFTITSGYGAIDVPQGRSLTVTGIVSGAGSLTKSGGGELILSAANNYSGGTTVDGGTLKVTGSSAIPSGSNLTVNATFDLDGLAVNVGSLSGSGTITSSVTGTAVLSIGSSNQDCTFSGVIQDYPINSSAHVGLAKVGPGILTLTGTNAYTGGTTLNGGTLSFVNGALGGVGTIAFAGNSTLKWSDGNTQDISSRLQISSGKTATLDVDSNNVRLLTGFGSGSGALTKYGSGRLILAGAHEYTGLTTVSAGALEFGYETSNGTVGGDISIGTGATLVFANPNEQDFVHGISGNGSLIKTGAGTLTLAGVNGYTGGTTVNHGVLKVGQSSAIPYGRNLTVSGNSTLDLNGCGINVGSLGGGGTITNGVGSATLTVGGNNQSSEFAGTLAGAISLTKADSGTLVLGGANTHTGDTKINGGTLVLANADALAESTLDYAYSGTLNFGTLIAATLGGLKGNKSLTLTNSNNCAVALTVGGNNASTVYSGALSGASSLTKEGDGTLILTSDNSGFTGTTTISAGALQLGNNSANGGLAGPIVDNAALVFARSGNAIIVDHQLSGNGSLRQMGSATVLLTADNPGYSGVITIDSSRTLQVGNGDTAGTLGTATVTNDGTLIFNRGAGNLTVDNLIGGVGHLTKQGAGTLTLTGNNTYSGTTTISQGTIIASDIDASDGSSSLGNATSAVILGDGRRPHWHALLHRQLGPPSPAD